MSQKPTINFDHLYHLDSMDEPKALHVRPVHDDAWEPFRKSRTFQLTKGEIIPRAPLRFSCSNVSGNIPMDFITTESVAPCLFSQRIFDCFREHGFTGWSTYPVTISSKHGADVPGYQGLVVTGRCGPIDDSRSIRVLLPPHVPGLPMRDTLVGLFFDPETWDGSDIFTPNGGFVFVVEKVKQALEEIGATNIAFRRLSEMENPRGILLVRQPEFQR